MQIGNFTNQLILQIGHNNSIIKAEKGKFLN